MELTLNELIIIKNSLTLHYSKLIENSIVTGNYDDFRINAIEQIISKINNEIETNKGVEA